MWSWSVLFSKCMRKAASTWPRWWWSSNSAKDSFDSSALPWKPLNRWSPERNDRISRFKTDQKAEYGCHQPAANAPTFEKVWDSYFVDSNCIHLQTLAPIEYSCREASQFQNKEVNQQSSSKMIVKDVQWMRQSTTVFLCFPKNSPEACVLLFEKKKRTRNVMFVITLGGWSCSCRWPTLTHEPMSEPGPGRAFGSTASWQTVRRWRQDWRGLERANLE